MLMIRLSLYGAKKKPTYRIVAIDKRKARNAKAKEYLGFFNPKTDVCVVDVVRVYHLVKQGAQLSNRVNSLLRKPR